MSQSTFDDNSTLVQVMAWCHQATSHYLYQFDQYLWYHMVSLDHNELTLYCAQYFIVLLVYSQYSRCLYHKHKPYWFWAGHINVSTISVGLKFCTIFWLQVSWEILCHILIKGKLRVVPFSQWSLHDDVITWTYFPQCWAFVCGIWTPSQYKDRLIYVWWFPC